MSKEYKCQRCGVEDNDTRTLWMACFYQMDEDKRVPYKQVEIPGGGRTTYYTLEVCKRCRADWMGAIGDWFVNTPLEDEDRAFDPLGNPRIVPIRASGTVRMISPQEYVVMFGDSNEETDDE